MIHDNYISAFENFMVDEVAMIKQHPGITKFYKPDGYYEKMYHYISTNPDQFILFKDSNVSSMEMEFAESVEKIKDKLYSLASKNHIPNEVLFIPRIKITNGYWESIIHIKVAELVRTLFDNESDEDFQTLSLCKVIERKSSIDKWTKTKNGKKFFI